MDLQLRDPWMDGTTYLRFEPTAFLERLAVLCRADELRFRAAGAFKKSAVPGSHHMPFELTIQCSNPLCH